MAAAVAGSCAGHNATIVGTSEADTLTGTAGPDVIAALEGNDEIDGLGGDDWICGGTGRDTITGNTGDDHVYGKQGGDTVVEGPGDDADFGGSTRLYGDVLTYESAGQPLTMQLATHSAVIGTDRDWVHGFDTYYGTPYEDVFTGSSKGDRFFGVAGEDDISGGDGNDYLRGDGDDDTILGGGGDDDISGGDGFDTLTDMAGDNIVYDDSLLASGAAVTTGSGNDDVYIESNDPDADYTVATGGGADQVYVNGSARTVHVESGPGNDLIQVDDDAITLRAKAQEGNDTVVLLPNPGQRASGGVGRDTVRFPLDYVDITLKLGSTGNISVPVAMELPGFENAWSGYGDDTITGSANRNVIFSGDGNDHLSGRGGDDKLNASFGASDIARGGEGLDRCLSAETTFSCQE